LPRSFTSFGIKNHFRSDIRRRAAEELRPGNDPELDRVCDHILQGTSLLPQPTADDLARGDAVETEFLQEQVRQARAQRVAVAEAAERLEEWQLTPPAAVLSLREPEQAANGGFRARGLRHWRHIPLAQYQSLAPAGGGSAAVFATLLRTLAEVKEPYVLFTNPTTFHDESFASSASDRLLADTSLSLDGVAFGAWLSRDNQTIADEIFTQRVPAANFEEAIRLWPDFAHPEALLPLIMFRTASLLAMFGRLSKIDDSGSAARELFGALRNARFEHTGLPMAVVVARSSER
jgi:hypothetical protein